MRTAAMFQQYSRVSNGLEIYKMVCWRRTSIVVGGRRICRLTPGQTWEFSPSWFVQAVWTKNDTILKDSAIKLLNDDIASSAGIF